MKLKKCNAWLSLLTLVLLLLHEGYQLYAYLSFYYNPTLSMVSGYALTGALALHAILSIVIVIRQHDSKRVAYKRLNIRTVLQRICGGLIVLLLPLHIFSFGLLKSSAGGVGYVLVEAVQILFYAVLTGHIATSFSGALVTLGWLEDIRKKRVVDVIAAIVCLILFVSASVIFTLTHTKMFNG